MHLSRVQHVGSLKRRVLSLAGFNLNVESQTLTFIPEYRSQIMRPLTYDAREGHTTPHLHVQICWADNGSLSLCE